MNTPSQIKYPWKATLRTVFSYFLSALIVIYVVIPIITDSMGVFLSPKVMDILGYVGLIAGGLVAMFTRIMANPVVNEQLAKIGLGAEPGENNVNPEG